MKFMITTALATLALAAPAVAQKAQPAPAPAQSGGLITHQPKLSGDAGKVIVELQDAVNKNDTAAIPAKLAAAKAAAKTADDRYAIGILHLKAANAVKDQAGMAAGLEEMLASGSVKPEEELGLYSALGQTYAGLKQWPKATDAYQHVVKLNPTSVDAVAGLAEAQISAGQPAAAVGLLQQGIKLQQASGQKAAEAWYKRAVSIAYEAKLPATAQLSRDWIAAYPSPDSWRNGVAIYRNLNSPDVEGTLDLLRLMQANNALTAAADYNLFATASAEQLNYNEAQAVLNAGIAAKVVDPASPLFKDTLAGLKAKKLATEADLVEAAKSAANGMAVLRIGDRYYGMGNYAKAVELYRQAMGKPGVDPNIANLHIGMALARSGDKAGATTAFNAVTGPRAEIAKYWLLYVQSKA